MFTRLRKSLSESIAPSSKSSSRSSSSAASIRSTSPPSPTEENQVDSQSIPKRKTKFIPTDPDAYSLKITAGPSKDPSTHIILTPNSSSETNFISTLKSGIKIKIGLRVLIRDHPGTYEVSERARGYFETEKHKGDRYSIQFSLELLPSSQEIQEGGEDDGGRDTNLNAKNLLWGNDFDNPIRNSLPPGFGAAMKFVKWVIDPGIVEDVYADKPYLFGPAFSSMNYINVSKSGHSGEEKIIVEENISLCCPLEVPDSENTSTSITLSDPQKRRKFFLGPQNREMFSLIPGEIYKMDFCNGFVDFNTFSLMLPHFKMNMLRYWDGQPLRYVLKYGEDDVVLVLQFMLVSNLEGEDGSEANKEVDEVG